METESTQLGQAASPVRGTVPGPGPFRDQVPSAPGRGFGDRGPLLERRPPRAVRLVPADGFRQALIERDLVSPAELVAQPRRVEQVAAVVARPVGDDRLERAGLSREL